jgi:hypothetical protein
MSTNFPGKTAVVYALLISLYGCSTGMTGTQTGSKSGGTATTAGAASADTTQTTANVTIPAAKTPALIFLSDTCPVSNVSATYEFAFLIPLLLAAAGALANALLPPLINGVTGAGADFLQKRADALNASSTAFTNGTLFTRPMDANGQLSPFVDRYGCLIFVRGGLTAAGGSPTVTDRWSNTFYANVNSALKKAGISTIQLTAPPEIYAEFNIHYQRLPIKLKPDQEAITGKTSYLYQTIGFAPTYVDYEKTGAERSSGTSKQLIFELVLTANSIQSANPSGTTILNQTIDLGDVSIGTVKKAADLIYKTPQYAKIPQPSKLPVKGSDGKTTTGYVDDSVAIAVQVSLTETEKAGDVERAVASSLRANESKISDAVTQAVVNAIPKPAAKK